MRSSTPLPGKACLTPWDAILAYVDPFPFYDIPTSGWIMDPPEAGTLFGLIGGTSSWKENAPTVDIQLDMELPITGWVTESQDPNDDNVGLWPYTDEVLESWSYTITSSKAE